MEEVLRWSLLVVGSCVIVGVAVHGIWVSRKNSEQKSTLNQNESEQEFQPNLQNESDWQEDEDIYPSTMNEKNDDFIADPIINFDLDNDSAPTDVKEKTDSQPLAEGEFDDLGVGAVRVVSSTASVTTPSAPSEAKVQTENIESSAEVSPEQEKVSQPDPVPVSKSTGKIYASVVTQPKPEYADKYQSLAAQTVAISQQERATPISSNVNVSTHSTDSAAAKNPAFVANESYQAPEPPPFLLKKEQSTSAPAAVSPTNVNSATEEPTLTHSKPEVEDKAHATLAEKLSLTEQARNLVQRKKAGSSRKRREPKIAEDQMRIDFEDESATENSQATQSVSQPKKTDQAQAKAEQPQEVLVLNVKMANEQTIPGAALLPMLLTLGFKFGDQDIFHRHVNSNGKGPVLFSLANMFKPGNFDIDNLENFTTAGVSLFMILPIEGDPHQVFNMMHNAARKISDEFSGQIYDGKRALLTKQSLQQYIEKIREFERQRLLNS